MREEPVETIEYRGFEIRVYSDDNPEDPREWGNLGTMVCWHRRSCLGDEQPKYNPGEYIWDKLENEKWNEIEITQEYRDWMDKDEENNFGVSDFLESLDEEELWKLFGRFYFMLPIYAYEHGNICLSTNNLRYPFDDRWDSGQLGFIYVDKEKVKTEFIDPEKDTLNRVFGCLSSEIETYSDYLSGEVYGFVIYDPEADDDLDSIWGYYGSDFEKSGLLESAKERIDGYAWNEERILWENLQKVPVEVE